MRAEPAIRDVARRDDSPYWSEPLEALAQRLGSGPDGLSTEEAERRLAVHGPNTLAAPARFSSARLLLQQVRSPLIWILVFAAAVAAFAGEVSDALVVLVILVLSVAVGFWRERKAHRAIAALQARIAREAAVIRAGASRRIPAASIVPGDVIVLCAGTLVPADVRLLEATDLFVNEAVLTGETYPVEKCPGAAPPDAALPARLGCLLAGTNVRSGTARALVVRTGRHTAYGEIAGKLRLRAPETEFDRGLRHFGAFLTSAMMVIVVLVFAVNVAFHRPVLEALLFSVALAVGLSPEMLPAILNVNLARSAQAMARHGVLVRRLAAIENLGSMDVLCTDKTGTLTEGVVSLAGAYDPHGEPSGTVLALAALNAAMQTGLTNPIDEALLRDRTLAGPSAEKLAEIPYDFIRKRLSVVVRVPEGALLVTKGAAEPLLEACLTVGGRPLGEAARAAIVARLNEWSEDGLRVLAVATRTLGAAGPFDRKVECNLELAGFVTFADNPKRGADRTLAELAASGVEVKIITGDNRLVARHVARAVGLAPGGTLTGAELDEISDESLWHLAERTRIFAEVDPNQKERVILALKKTGHVVGFLGDGVNDAPAMHAADTSISVEGAVDVAREAADFVLLEPSLDVLRSGILAGRTTFANTLKYILTTTSANLGNMVSMAIASLFLPFLPLLASQILLNNFLSDVPALGLAGDSVDEELVARPRRWDMRFIRRFMIEFGVLSSGFDLLCFAVLLLLFRTGAEGFRTGWFVLSLATELAVALVVRTRRRFYSSRPGTFLLWSTIAVAVVAVALPYLPLAPRLGFVRLPPGLLLALLGITAAYVLAAEVMKRFFYRSRPEGLREIAAPRARHRATAALPLERSRGLRLERPMQRDEHEAQDRA